MIEIDYGKEAYYKLQQLENKLKNLEKEQEKYSYQELRFFLGGESNVLEYVRSFKVEALKDGKHYFHFNMRSNLIGIVGVIVKVYVNDVMSYSLVCSIDVDYPFIVEPSLIKGENVIKIVMTSTQAFSVDYLNASVNGFVDYSKADNRLSIYRAENVDYVAYLNQSNLEVYTYKTVDGLRDFRRISKVKDGCVLGVDGWYLYLAVVNLNDTLSIKRIDLSNLFVDDLPLNVSGVTSVAGCKNGDKIKILFCKLYSLYAGDYNLETNAFTYNNTNKKAVKVYAEANLLGCYVIKDRSDNCSFLSNTSLCKIGLGDNYHIINGNGVYDIEYADKSKLLSVEVSGVNTSKPIIKDYCDERLLLSCGKYLMRIRDAIIIN